MDINIAEFHFIRPYWFLAIVPAIMVFILLLKNKLNQGNWSHVCDAELLPFVLQDRATQQSRWIISAGAVSSLLTIIALAGPTWERLPTPVFRNDAALVIALDLSRSMDSTDIKPSRLSRARYKIADILNRRKDGQTALLVYAGDAFTVTPLTEDSETIASQISALTTAIMPSQGSNAVVAIEKAVDLLKQAGLQKGEILLVTDGVDYDETIDAVESLKGYHLSILGVGTADGAPIKTAQGGFIKDAQGSIVVPKLESSVLSRLTKKGKGRYKTISSDDSDIESLLNQFDTPAEKNVSEDNGLLIEQWSEKGPWLLLLVLPFAALSFRKGLLTLALLCLFPYPEPSYALDWKDLWQTQNQQAHHAFKQKDYPRAAEQFNNPQWKAAAQYKAGQFEQALDTLQHDPSSTGLYNQGNAMARSGKLTEAIKAYKQSLQIDPENEDAKYNKEQVEKALKKQKQQQKNKKQQNNKQQPSDQKDSKQSKKNKENNEQSDSANQSGEQSDSKQQQNTEQTKPGQDSEQNKSEQAQKNKKKQDAKETESQQNKKKQEQDSKEAESKQIAKPSESNESKQANEQWLKRIPDDPAGLLRRKFKYQYGQRGRKNDNNQAW